MPARKSQDRGQNTPEKKTKEPKGHITERPLIYATIHDGEDPLKVNQAVSPVRPGELVQVIQRKRKLSKSPSNIVSTQLPPSKELENTPQNRGGPVQGMTKTPKQKSNRVKEKSSGPRQTRLSNNGLGHPARVKKCKRTSVVRDQAPGNCAASEISGPTKHHKPLDTRVDKKFKLKQTRLDVATEIFPDKPRQNAWTPPEGSVLENPSKFTTGKLSSDQVDSLFSVSPDADISEPPPLGSRSLLLNKYDNHDADEDRKSFKEIKMEQPKLAERKCHIEGAVSSSKKPRLLRTCQKNRILSTDEQDTGSQVEELEDEIKMLDAGKVLAKRTRDESSRNKALSNRQRLLATLRNKRKGIAPSNTDNYDVDSSTDSQPLYDSTSEKSSGSVNSENFIVESEDEDFDSTQMPVEFQMQSHQKLSHHFKVLVQYEVHRLLNPAMNLDQNYFQLALKAFEKKVDSIRDSVLISTAWKHNFSSAIKARPIFSDAESNTGMRCDACNITNRNATWIVRFQGPRYHRDTLMPTSSSDSDSDSTSSIVDDDRAWFLGRFCHARARWYHKFYHWRFNLRSEIESALTTMGYMAPRKSREFASMNDKKRTETVDIIVVEMDRNGSTSRLWLSFKYNLEKAQSFVTTGTIAN